MQLDICRAMLTPHKKLYGAGTDNDEYAVTDGYVAYVFGRDECVFDTSKLAYYDQLAAVLSDNKGDIDGFTVCPVGIPIEDEDLPF